MKQLKLIILVAVAVLGFSSCNLYSHSMKGQNAIVELKASDFEISEQFSAEVEVNKILFIDWARLFGKSETGSISGVGFSIIGDLMADPANGYALYKLMQEHPGYDVVIYPQYEKHKKAPVLGTDLFSKTTVKVTAKLGKLK